MLKSILLGLVILASALQPAHATDPAADFLAQVKAQTAAAKAEAEKAVATAQSKAKEAIHLTVETRISCEDLIEAAVALDTAAKEAQTANDQLLEARADARKVAAAAVVQMQATREFSPRLQMEAERVDPYNTREDPATTRARVIGVCKAILAKPAPVAPNTTVPPSVATGGWMMFRH